MLTHDCYGCKSSFPCDVRCQSLSHPPFSLCDSCLDDLLENYSRGAKENANPKNQIRSILGL